MPIRLPPLRPSRRAAPPELVSRRSLLTPPPPPSVVHYGGVPCVVWAPEAPRAVVAYFHGGGYRMGSAAWSAPFAAQLAASAQVSVVAVDYRLAPEHPFPAALHDAAAAYEALPGRGQLPVVLAGDSAGGGLAAALVAAASASEAALPAALVLMSPWLDLTCTAATFESRSGTDVLFSLTAAREAADLYLQGHDARDPLASPAFASLEAWPPTLALASASEVLLDDSLGFASMLARTGSAVRLHVEAGVPHAWPAVMPDQPAAGAALAEMGRFLDAVLA